MLRAGMLDFINIDSYLGGSAAVPVTKLEEEIRAREDRQREAEHNWEQWLIKQEYKYTGEEEMQDRPVCVQVNISERIQEFFSEENVEAQSNVWQKKIL